MSAREPSAGPFPDVTDPSAAIVTVEHRDVAGEGEQAAVADATVADWAGRPWSGQLRSLSCFVSVDPVAAVGLRGGTDTPVDAPRLAVVTFAQWTAAPASPGLPAFERYRSHQPPTRGPVPPTGCVVLVTVDFDGPDQARQRRWIDTVIAALDTEPEPAPGLVAAHFHTSTDGRRILNYAEWTSARAHRDALETGPASIGPTDRPEWRRVRRFPGVIANTVGRYALHRALAPAGGPP